MDGLSQALDFREQLQAALEGVVHAPELGEVLHGALAKLALSRAETQQVPLVDISAFLFRSFARKEIYKYIYIYTFQMDRNPLGAGGCFDSEQNLSSMYVSAFLFRSFAGK